MLSLFCLDCETASDECAFYALIVEFEIYYDGVIRIEHALDVIQGKHRHTKGHAITSAGGLGSRRCRAVAFCLAASLV